MDKNVIVTVDRFGLDVDKLNQRLVDEGFSVHWEPSLTNTKDTEKLIALTKGYSFVIAGGELWNQEAIEANKGTLRMITRLGAGYDKVDLAAATEAGIAVANTPGANSPAIGEHTVALMLSVLRSIPLYDRKTRQGQWSTVMLNQLYGKTVGFVGFGAIARIVASMLKGFSVTMLAYDLYKNEKAANDLGVQYVEMDELLANSDVVSLHTPLTEETEGMANLAFFRKMKRSAILINTSRGKVVKEQDLAVALKEGIIGGAGLDVFEQQPLPAGSPLSEFDNVVMSSHIGGMSPEAYAAMVGGCTDNILDLFYGRPIRNLLNPGYDARRA